jgi:hypothetical protein
MSLGNGLHLPTTQLVWNTSLTEKDRPLEMGFRCTAYAEFEDFAKQHNGGGG